MSLIPRTTIERHKFRALQLIFCASGWYEYQGWEQYPALHKPTVLRQKFGKECRFRAKVAFFLGGLSLYPRYQQA